MKENKAAYNGNIFCYFTEKVNNSALITVLNHSKNHRKCWCCGTPVFATVLFFVWCLFCLKVLCEEEFDDTKGIIIEVENTTQWPIIVCPFCFVHLLSVLLRLTDSDCPFRIFKLFLLYIKRKNNFRILVTRQRYHW
jgi:hypothetical protein